MFNFFSSILDNNPEVVNKPVLFVTAGQSNHNANFGQANISDIFANYPELVGSQGEVYSFRLNGTPSIYSYANWDDDLQTGDPQWGYSGNTRTAAPLHGSFVKGVVNSFNSVYLVSHGRDGTRLYEDAGSIDWNINSTEEHYFDFTQRIDTAVAWMESNIGIKGVDWYFGGFIWYQGESDQNEPYRSAYEQNEFDLINDMRLKYGSKMLFMSVKIVPYVGNIEGFTAINVAKTNNKAKNIRNFVIETSDLTLGTDNLHITTDAQVTLGYRIATLVVNNVNLII